MALPRPKIPQPPPHPIPTLQTLSFKHSVYGLLNPCYVPSGAPDLHDDTPSISSSGSLHNDSAQRAQSCATILAHPSTQLLLSRSPIKEVPTIIISFHRTFATHLRLAHWSGPWFNVTVFWGNHDTDDSPDAKNKILISLDERFGVEWVTGEDEGLAFRSKFGGMEGPDANAPEGVGKAGAEVWVSNV
ncbi:hypothetical protein H0H87_009626 [Tephrocybe sp. NHM501043]|nr:hypothetical protein H0H87_009626 [Tephrocybe sp. NHM501043]